MVPVQLHDKSPHPATHGAHGKLASSAESASNKFNRLPLNVASYNEMYSLGTVLKEQTRFLARELKLAGAIRVSIACFERNLRGFHSDGGRLPRIWRYPGHYDSKMQNL